MFVRLVLPAWTRNEQKTVQNNSNSGRLFERGHGIFWNAHAIHFTWHFLMAIQHIQTYRCSISKNIFSLVRYVFLSFRFISFHFNFIRSVHNEMRNKAKKHPYEHETMPNSFQSVWKKRHTLKWKYLWKSKKRENKRSEKGIFRSIFILFQLVSCNMYALQNICKYRKTESIEYVTHIHAHILIP